MKSVIMMTELKEKKCSVEKFAEMEKLESLKLTNRKEIDTSMAKEYITKSEDGQWPEGDLLFIEVEPGNIIKTDDVYGALNKYLNENLNSENMEDIGNTIAKKIEENTEMFVQLEYLARGTDPRDVREGQIKLLSQLARCSTSMWNGMHLDMIYFTESMPLYNLAFVFWGLYGTGKFKSKPAIIIDNKKLKPLCKFFVKICTDAGLGVFTVYTRNIEQLKKQEYYSIYDEPADNMGCTGVVAERADLDSAIDCFINSSVSAPWRFKHIYVQESIFEDFKVALRAKAGDTSGGDVSVGDKIFQLESVGPCKLPTTAFRSARELLGLIDTPYLSLWAAETALSHEIALRSPSSTIWINDYASFYGPPRSALSVYNISAEVSRRWCPDINETLSKWSKLQTEERFDVIKAALTASKCEKGPKQYLPDFKQEYRADALLEITDKTICFGTQKHLGLIAYYNSLSDKRQWLNVLKALLNGNGIYCDYLISADVVNELQKFGIPIVNLDSKFSYNNLPFPMLLERLKVIRTNYGTIFAN